MNEQTNEIEIDIDTVKKYQYVIEVLFIEPLEPLVEHFIKMNKKTDDTEE